MSEEEFERYLAERGDLVLVADDCAHVDMPEGRYCDKSALLEERYCLLHLAEHRANGMIDEPNTPPVDRSKGYEGCICPCHFGNPVVYGKECMHCDPYIPFDH